MCSHSAVATICWNHVFHQKFITWNAGGCIITIIIPYSYSQCLLNLIIAIQLAKGQSVFVSCTSSTWNAASYKRKYNQLYYNISYSYVQGQLYILRQLCCTNIFTFQLYSQLSLKLLHAHKNSLSELKRSFLIKLWLLVNKVRQQKQMWILMKNIVSPNRQWPNYSYITISAVFQHQLCDWDRENQYCELVLSKATPV